MLILSMKKKNNHNKGTVVPECSLFNSSPSASNGVPRCICSGPGTQRELNKAAHKGDISVADRMSVNVSAVTRLD